MPTRATRSMTEPTDTAPTTPHEDRETLDAAIADIVLQMGMAPPEESARLSMKLIDLLDRRHRFRAESRDEIDTIATRLDSAVNALADITSVPELVREACERVAELSGARRVMLSRLTQDRVVPLVCFDSDQDSANPLPGEFALEQGSPEWRAATTSSVEFGPAVDVNSHIRWGNDDFTVIPIEVAGTMSVLVHLDVIAAGPTADALAALAQFMGLCLERAGLETSIMLQEQAVRESAVRLIADSRAVSQKPERPADGKVGGSHRTAFLIPLTDRETDVARLVLTGASNSTIASELVITIDTVKSHVKSILRKSGTTNRAELIAKYH